MRVRKGVKGAGDGMADGTENPIQGREVQVPEKCRRQQTVQYLKDLHTYTPRTLEKPILHTQVFNAWQRGKKSNRGHRLRYSLRFKKRS